MAEGAAAEAALQAGNTILEDPSMMTRQVTIDTKGLGR